MTEAPPAAVAIGDRPFGGSPNKALQQTRSALTTIAAALAAERRCSAHFAGLTASDRPGIGLAYG